MCFVEVFRISEMFPACFRRPEDPRYWHVFAGRTSGHCCGQPRVFVLSGVLGWRKSGGRDEGQLPNYPGTTYAYVQHHPNTGQEEFLIRGHDTAQLRNSTQGAGHSTEPGPKTRGGTRTRTSIESKTKEHQSHLIAQITDLMKRASSANKHNLFAVMRK